MTTSTSLQSARQFMQLSWRILLLLNLFRTLIPVVLGGLFFLISPAPLGTQHPALFVAVSTAYFMFALAAFFSLKRRWPSLDIQAITQAMADVIAINLLTYASGGMASGIASLMLLPVASCALIVRPRTGLLIAASATLGLLIQQTLNLLKDSSTSNLNELTASGLLGALLFALSAGAALAAKKLQESEALLEQRDVDIADLAELNDFIVQHLRESILVVDEQDRVRLINESAAQLLKDGLVEAGTLLGEVSPRLLYLLDIWRRQTPEWHTSTLTLVSADGGTLIQPHFVALATKSPGPTLIFLEDTSIVAGRVQQTKLAALGRLSASIAHEIRNPVGAMSHAAQLLSESPALGPQDQRLTQIIRHNGDRVSTIINNILQLSRRDATQATRLSLGPWLEEFRDQFRESLQLDEAPAVIDPGYPVEVHVDPSHLHQILWNLSENALKYGRNIADARVRIELRFGRISATNRPFLEVTDRGAGISQEQAEHIFEPFFTAGEGGTGLGLFIARELAHCNRAVLLYEPRQGGGSIFRLVFSDPQRWEI